MEEDVLPKILLVDEDANLRSAYHRHLRGRYLVEAAMGGERALELMASHGPFDVVVSEMRLPGMEGVEFLTAAENRAPDTIRIALTDNSDPRTAPLAINQGHVFRFLAKPCTHQELSSAVEAGCRQRQGTISEKLLLKETLMGSIAVMLELSSLVDAESFGRAQRLAALTQTIAEELGVEEPWILRMAAMLSQIGMVMVPFQVREKRRLGEPLTAPERAMLTQAPEAGARLLEHIPRLEEVTDTLRYQKKYYNGMGHPGDDRKGEELPVGSRILAAVSDLLDEEAATGSRIEGFINLLQTPPLYDPKVLAVMARMILPTAELEARDFSPELALPLTGLRAGMVLAQDLLAVDGTRIALASITIGHLQLKQFTNIAQLIQIQEPVYVRMP